MITIHDMINFVETHKAFFTLARAWLARETATISKNGGVVNLAKYFWYGTPPPTTSTTSQINQPTNNQITK